MVTLTHAKINNIPDWTQEQLNTVIAGGAAPLPPAGTVLNDIVLPTDWNADHVIDLSLSVTTQSGTTYTLQSSDNGTVIQFTNAAGCTVTCPSSLSVGFNVWLLQLGAAQVTVSAGSGATVNNDRSNTKTFGLYSACSLLVYENSGGSAAKYIFGGATG